VDFVGGSRPTKLQTFFDPPSASVLVYGGGNRVWTLNLTGDPHWTELSLSGGPQCFYLADYDPVGGVLYVSLGDELWTLTLERPTPVTLLDLSAAWDGPAALVRWTVADGSAGAEFHVYREEPDRMRTRLTATAVTGDGPHVFRDDGAPRQGGSYWVVDLGRDGTATWHGPVVLGARGNLGGQTLAVFPNPFGSRATLQFRLDRPGRVVAQVFDLTGREVARPVDREFAAGEAAAAWDGRNRTGRDLPAGFYVLQVKTPEGVFSRKITKLR
jgi:hypothetical protein